MKNKFIFKKYLLALAAFSMLGFFASGCTNYYDDDYGYAQGTFYVPDDFLTIQEAVDFALPGDQVLVRAGVYSPFTNGEIYPIFMKEGVDLIGEGIDNTILDAESTEGILDLFQYRDATIRDMTLRGGLTFVGGAILAENSNATLQNLQLIGNRVEEKGSAIYILDSDGLTLENIEIAQNKKFGNQNTHPAQIEIENSTIHLINNVVSQGDSDGVRLDPDSSGAYENNIFFENGSNGQGVGMRVENPNSAAKIQYNLFFGNEEDDFFFASELRSAAEADAVSADDQVEFNFSDNPDFNDADNLDFRLQNGSPAINAGNPAPEFNDPDQTRNDIGAFGGPGAILY